MSERLSAVREVSVHHPRLRPFGPQPNRTHYCSAIRAWPGYPPDEGPLRRLAEFPVPRVVLPDLLAEAGEFGGNQFRH